MRAAAAVALTGLVLGCSFLRADAPSDAPYRPDRRDYFAFQSLYPELIEPNYLPFMVHRVSLGGGRGEALVLCRWSDASLPLPVYVAPPRIPDSLQDEFAPRPASDYVDAVHAALDIWQRALAERPLFRRVERERDAALSLRLVGKVAPAPESTISVLGSTALGRACRVRGTRDDDSRADVEYRVEEVRIYVADDYGLLNPDQVERVALHEIGHALGMRGHSPVPADLMFPVARDRLIVRGLSDQDANSFATLYGLPNGLIYARLAETEARPPPVLGPRSGPPALAPGPHVDARFGYEFRPIEGWLRIETPQGMIAVDGVSWDYEASFQILVRGYATIEDYLERYGGWYVGGGRVTERRELSVDGRRALRLLVMGRLEGMAEELTFIEIGDGRVVVVIADCPGEVYEAYRPWFAASLDTLEIRRFRRP